MPERLWLDVPYSEKDLAKAAGARWNPEARRWYAPAPSQALARWSPRPPLPTILPGEDRSFGTGLFVDLVPSSCWFTNVRSCVVEAEWDRVRLMVYGRAANRCEICGRQADRDRRIWLEAHERWEYDEAANVQHLRRLVCMCTPCHEATHYGLATVRGRDEEALEHLMTVNGWARTVAIAHVNRAFDNWRRRSATEWALDLTMLTAAGVTIARPSRR